MAGSPLSVVLCCSFAAITVQTYDTLLTLHDEVRFIWSKPCSSYVKWLFLFARYFALGTAITDRVLFSFAGKRAPLPTSHCQSLYLYEVTSTALVLTSFELILVLRVYLLYRRSRRIRMIFICAYGLGIVLTFVFQNRTWRHLRFTPDCITLIPPQDIVTLSISAIVCPFSILCLTLFKYVAALRAGWGKAPLLQLLVRDGVGAFVIMIFIWVAILLAAIFTPNSPSLLGHYLFVGIVPSLGCRVIINMQKMSVEDRQPQLSTMNLQAPTTDDTYALGYHRRGEP